MKLAIADSLSFIVEELSHSEARNGNIIKRVMYLFLTHSHLLGKYTLYGEKQSQIKKSVLQNIRQE